MLKRGARFWYASPLVGVLASSLQSYQKPSARGRRQNRRLSTLAKGTTVPAADPPRVAAVSVELRFTRRPPNATLGLRLKLLSCNANESPHTPAAPANPVFCAGEMIELARKIRVREVRAEHERGMDAASLKQSRPAPQLLSREPGGRGFAGRGCKGLPLFC
jgi:hypothetical protein